MSSSSSVDRLELLGDNIKLSLLERKRAASLQLEASPETDREIQHSLDTLLAGIEQLEKDQAALEESGEAYTAPSHISSQRIQESEDALIRLRQLHHDLQSQFTSPGSSSSQPTGIIPPSGLPPRTSSLRVTMPPPLTEEQARTALMPTTPRGTKKSVRFTEHLIDEEEAIDAMDNTQLLQMHRRIIDEQDESLERLGLSIRNQREISIQIGDELETHAQMLDEVDAMVDRHANRLDSAKNKLNKFAKAASEHGSLMIIGILIVILIILIAVLKW